MKRMTPVVSLELFALPDPRRQTAPGRALLVDGRHVDVAVPLTSWRLAGLAGLPRHVPRWWRRSRVAGTVWDPSSGIDRWQAVSIGHSAPRTALTAA